jgi:hypothetical protein
LNKSQGKNVARGKKVSLIKMGLAVLIGILACALANDLFAALCDDLGQFDNNETLTAHGWAFIEETEAVRTYNRESSRSRVREVVAKSVIDGPPWRAFAAVSDYDRYADFMPYVKQSETIRKEAGARWVFQHLVFFFPISDRSYTIKLSDVKSRPRDKFYCVEWSLADDSAANRDMPGIVPSVNDGLWILRPLEQGTKTDVTYFLHSDPGGWLPAGIIDRVNSMALPAVIRAVQKRMMHTDYDRLDPERSDR